MPLEYSEMFAVKSPLHRKVIDAFKDRLALANRGLETRSQKWVENEEAMKAYIPKTDNDNIREQNKKAGMPTYVTMEIPFSYATLLTIHTYLSSIFLSRTPIIQVSGRHGESQQSEQSMEAIMDYQIMTGGALPFLYVWLLDPLRYGHGILGHYWDEEVIATTVREEVPMTFMGVEIGKPKMVEKLVEERGYVGAKFFNVRPQDFKFDPRVPLMRFQEGEFCIRHDSLAWNRVIERELSGQYFNIKEAKMSVVNQRDRDEGSAQTQLPVQSALERFMFTGGDAKTPAQLSIDEFHWEIIPKELGVGTNPRPEKWVFTISSENTIIGAQPLGMLHNKFPFDALEYEIGGYEIFNRSVFETMKELNDTMSWLFNSHFYNVRKTLNDQFIVDPSRIDVRDMEGTNPGRLIKIKPAGYGGDINQFAKQFPTVDVTRSNLSDTEYVERLAQKLSGSNENMMGQLQSGGRKTATESRISTAAGANRLKTTAEWWSACGWSPMVQKLIMQTQQMYDDDRLFKVVGDTSQFETRSFLRIDNAQLAGFYDFTPVDGTLPVDRFAQANLWQQILQGIPKLPQVAATYDIAKIFAFTAQLAGLKNISQFKIKVIPDGEAGVKARSGENVPITPGAPTEPRQIPGLGQTT